MAPVVSPLIGPSPEKKDYPENQEVQEDLYGGHDKVLVISEDGITRHGEDNYDQRLFHSPTLRADQQGCQRST